MHGFLYFLQSCIWIFAVIIIKINTSMSTSLQVFTYHADGCILMLADGATNSYSHYHGREHDVPGNGVLNDSS